MAVVGNWSSGHGRQEATGPMQGRTVPVGFFRESDAFTTAFDMVAQPRYDPPRSGLTRLQGAWQDAGQPCTPEPQQAWRPSLDAPAWPMPGQLRTQEQDDLERTAREQAVLRQSLHQQLEYAGHQQEWMRMQRCRLEEVHRIVWQSLEQVEHQQQWLAQHRCQIEEVHRQRAWLQQRTEEAIRAAYRGHPRGQDQAQSRAGPWLSEVQFPGNAQPRQSEQQYDWQRISRDQLPSQERGLQMQTQSTQCESAMQAAA